VTGSKRAQVATDFLASYGIAIVIIIIALAVAFEVSSGTSYAFQSQCLALAGFSCGYYSISGNGVLTISLQQATGGNINVYGIACSTQETPNSLPSAGNIYVANTVAYYPPSDAPPAAGITIPSSGQQLFDLYCYTPTGIATSSVSGGAFVGYLWLNYSIANSDFGASQQVATLQLEYT
jgi:hypothetical protein